MKIRLSIRQGTNGRRHQGGAHALVAAAARCPCLASNSTRRTKVAVRNAARWSAFGLSAAGLIVICLSLVGCKPATQSPVTEAHQPATGDALPAGDMPEPGEPEKAVDFTPPEDAEGSLAKHARKVHDFFASYDEVEELIYPPGWVRRRMLPDDVSHELTARKDDDQPQGGVIRLRLIRVCSRIHTSRAATAGDETLLPFSPMETREKMLHDPLHQKLEPLLLEMTYVFQDGAWRRTGWRLEPQLARGRNWLDRLGVP